MNDIERADKEREERDRKQAEHTGGDLLKWIKLHNKIGKQPLKNLRDKNITVIINDKETLITGVKFKTDGTPYLIANKKMNRRKKNERL